jgi:putative hydrolase of the HAD superfamily
MIKLFNAERFSKCPDAILFDTDNTLYSYEPAHRAAMTMVRDKVARTLSISPAVFDEGISEARRTTHNRLGNTASSHSRLLYMQRFLEDMGLGSQVLWALDFEQTYWRTFLNNAVLFPGLKDLLDDLRLLHIPTVVITDLTAQIQFRKVVYFGLDRYFDYIVTSEEAGIDKPSPVPFDLAIEKLKLKGSCVWMIGDSPVNDIKGARDAINAVTLQKTHDGSLVGTGSTMPDAAFQEYSEVRALLDRLRLEL